MFINQVTKGKIVIGFTFLIAIPILAFDLLLPLGVAGGVPYVVLVLIGLWAPWKNYIYFMALLGTVLTIFGYFASPAGGITWVVLTNRALAVFAIWITAILVTRIRRGEEDLQAVIDTAAEGIISIDEKGLIQTFNKSAESIFGYKAEEVLGKDVSILVPPPYRDQHAGYIERYLSTGEANIIGIGRRLMVQHKDGHLIPVYLNVSKVKHGVHSTFTGIIRNLAREEEKEAQLQQLWRVVDQSPVSIIITDARGDIEYVNPHFCQVTGYQLDEVLGKNSRILKSGETPSDAYAELWQTISRGEVWRGVLQNKKKNGELFWESATICPVYDQDNDITHYIALKEDITDLREKDLMLTRAMKLEAVGRMTDGIAHDFNNLLTIILGNLQLLQEDLKTAGHTSDEELIDDALSAAHDGSELINRLLTFSRKQDQVVEPVGVNAFLNELERLLRRTVPEVVEITLELAEDVDTIIIDPNRLGSAMLNLVTNAKDAMPDGGYLKISTHNELIKEPVVTDGGKIDTGNYVAITVSDSGSGMEDEVLHHILEPFYTTKSGGTGLGLSMVYDFIKQSGGGLRINTMPGGGTTISMLLPVSDSDNDWLTVNVVEPDELPVGKETVLLVEDREKVRRFAGRILTSLGYRLLEAENATQALEYLHTNADIDLLFSDIIMPGEMNGRQLATRAIANRPSLLVLLTTGMEPSMEVDRNYPVEFPLLPKPYTARQLAQSVRNVLDQR